MQLAETVPRCCADTLACGGKARTTHDGSLSSGAALVQSLSDGTGSSTVGPAQSQMVSNARVWQHVFAAAGTAGGAGACNATTVSSNFAHGKA